MPIGELKSEARTEFHLRRAVLADFPREQSTARMERKL